MKALWEKDGIQLEITNHCIHACSNCTRFCGSHQHPYHMDWDFYVNAVDSLEGYPRMIGIMGGEPLLHPQFEQMCAYLLSKFPREQLGLWSTFPDGFAHYRKTICKTFGNILLNDHTLPEVKHSPLLVGIQEIVKDPADMWVLIDKCWVQNSWSGSINPKGAFFCEVAAARAVLEDGPAGWPVEKGWWKRVPMHFREQAEHYCPPCGGALPLPHRTSMDERDDISPLNVELLRGKSRKVDNKRYVLWDTKTPVPLRPGAYPPQEYKEIGYRSRVAGRYGIGLTLNAHRYQEPYLLPNWVHQSITIPA